MSYKILFFAFLVLAFADCKKRKQGPNEIFIEGNAYSPASLTVAVGTRVKWYNQEKSVHTVTSDVPTVFDSKDITKYNSFSFVFYIPGTFGYHCTHHAGMTGTITVVQ